MFDELKTGRRQQSLIFGGIEARMVERIAPIRADRLAAAWAGVEHQNGAGRSMRGKDAKHLLLIFRPQVEKAVPSQDPAKLPIERQASHIADDPLLIRHPGLAERYQGRR